MKKNLLLLFSVLVLFTACKKQDGSTSSESSDSATAIADSSAVKKLPAAPVPNTIMTEAFVKKSCDYYLWMGLANGKYS